MKKWIVVSLCMILFLLIGCEKVEEKEVSTKPVIAEENLLEYTSNDGIITFKIFNQAKFGKGTLTNIKNGFIQSYDIIKGNFPDETRFQEKRTINVYVYPNTGRSTAKKNSMNLYIDWNSQFLILHELAHSLLMEKDYFDSISQEGFATYLEGKYETPSNFFMRYPYNMQMRALIENDRVVPLIKFTDQRYINNMLFAIDADWNIAYIKQLLVYVETASFVDFLINTYGIEKFVEIMNRLNNLEKVYEVYGKTFYELEEEWLAYVVEEIPELPSNYKNTSLMKSYFDAFEDMTDTALNAIFSK